MKKKKRELGRIEPAIDRLKEKASGIQAEIDSSADEGWTVLADLTDRLNAVNDEIDGLEMEWLEMAEDLQELEEEEANAADV